MPQRRISVFRTRIKPNPWRFLDKFSMDVTTISCGWGGLSATERVREVPMERAELKRKVDQMEALPTLSGVAAQLLQLTNDESSDSMAIARVIESDQALTARPSPAGKFLFIQILDGNHHGRARAVVGPWLQHHSLHGAGHGRSTPVPARRTAKVRSRCGSSGNTRWRVRWPRSLLAGKRQGSVDKDEAFVAGLLHDIGKIILSTCMKDEYDEVVERARNDDLPLLEVEQEVFGATHSEVGKWLGGTMAASRDVLLRRFGCITRPPGTIPSGDFNADLISMVRVADAITRAAMIGSSGNDRYDALTEEDYREVGLSESGVEEIRSSLCKLVEERASIIDLELAESELYVESLQKANMTLSRMSLKAEENNRRLSRRARRFRALHEMNGQLTPSQTLNDVLGILGKSLRDGFDIVSGMCYVVNGHTHSLRGKHWQDGGSLSDLEVALNDDGSDVEVNGHGVDPTVRSVLAEIALQFQGDSWLGQGRKDILRRHDILVVPMLAEGRSVGQIVIDLRSDMGGSDADLVVDEILAFAAAAGMAVSRVYVNCALKRRSEELAAAMLKKEQAHKQLLHSERLAAVGKMAAGAAHEINNPLAIISGRAQMMLQKETDPANEKALKLMVDQCARASKILTDLMGFARPALPKKEALNINTVVFEALWMFESRYESRGITLNREFEEGLPKSLGGRKSNSSRSS